MSTSSVEGLLGLVRASQVSMPAVLPLLRLAAVTIFLGLVARALYNVFLHPLCVIPGPWWFAVSGLARFRMYTSGTAHHTIREMHIKYGDMVRIGPNEVSFAAAHGWNDVFGQKRITGGGGHGGADGHSGPAYLENPKEDLFYSNISRPAGLLYMGQSEHSEARKTLNTAFSAKAVAEQEPLVQRHVDKLVDLLRSVSQEGPKENVIDIGQYVNWAFFDIIGDLSFGEPFGSLTDGAEHAWVALIPRAVRGAVFVASLQRLLGMSLARVAVWLSMTHEQRNRMLWHRAMSAEKVNRRAAQGPGRPDFMTPMLENREFWTTMRLHSSLSTFITAGSETSSTTLSAAIFYLTTPTTMGSQQTPLQKLVAEVRGAFATDADINFAGVRNLPYLGAVLDESLRMHPPAVWGFGRQARVGGVTVAGGQVYLPEKTVMTVCHYAMFRNPRNFAHPDAFVPERWLGTDSRFQNDQRDAFQPFSYGPRNCVGRYLATAEMRTILARIVYNFDLAIQPESLGWAVDQKAYAFWEKGPLMAAVTERSDKA